MRMQEPEQWQESIEGIAGDDYQEQKIYPQEELSWRGKALGIIMIILSSIGFFPAVAGIVASALVLKYANGQEVLLVAGVLGLVSAILVMLVCIAIFVIAVVALALRASSARRRTGRVGWRARYP
jgi:MFS family permease